MKLFLIAAIVLIVFALVALTAASGLCLGTAAPIWTAAALLAYFTDCLVGSPVPAVRALVVRVRRPATPASKPEA